MIDFSSQINFLKPNINLDYDSIYESTTNSYKTLLELLENRYKVKQEQIELFNGFSSAIYSILKFLDKKYCFIYAPCTLEYKKASENLNYEVRLINRFENLFLPIKEQSVVIFSNPSYLDGTYYDLENLFKYWASKNSTVIIDESLLDFCGEDAAVKYLDTFKNLYIVKDFSKYYANRNLSISTIFSTKENMENLRKIEPENKLSIFDVRYLEHSLQDVDFRAITNSVNIKNRMEIEKIFHSFKYVEFLFSSSTNSLLVKLKNISSKQFMQKLKEKDIEVYNCLKYDFIDESFLNIYVTSKDKIEKLKEVIYAI